MAGVAVRLAFGVAEGTSPRAATYRLHAALAQVGECQRDVFSLREALRHPEKRERTLLSYTF